MCLASGGVWSGIVQQQRVRLLQLQVRTGRCFSNTGVQTLDRVDFLTDERAAGIGWVNTYAGGGMRNGFNNEPFRQKSFYVA